MDFREILLKYLQLTQMTQTEFARLVGIKQIQVGEWLKGKAKPGYDIIKQIIDNLDEPAGFQFDSMSEE